MKPGKVLKIESVLRIYSKILFAIFGITRELQEVYSTFDAQKTKKNI